MRKKKDKNINIVTKDGITVMKESEYDRRNLEYKNSHSLTINNSKITDSAVIMADSIESGRIYTRGEDGIRSTAVTESDVKSILDSYLKQFEYKSTFEHRCHNWGGTLELDIDQHIFNCPYCDSVYAIGTNQVNSIPKKRLAETLKNPFEGVNPSKIPTESRVY